MPLPGFYAKEITGQVLKYLKMFVSAFVEKAEK